MDVWYVHKLAVLEGSLDVGHAGMFAHECTRTLVRDFLNAPLQKRDTGCLQAIPPAQFVTDIKAMNR